MLHCTYRGGYPHTAQEYTYFKFTKEGKGDGTGKQAAWKPENKNNEFAFCVNLAYKYPSQEATTTASNPKKRKERVSEHQMENTAEELAIHPRPQPV